MLPLDPPFRDTSSPLLTLPLTATLPELSPPLPEVSSLEAPSQEVPLLPQPLLEALLREEPSLPQPLPLHQLPLDT